MAYTLRWQQAQPQEVDLSETAPDPGNRNDRKLWRMKKRGFKQPPKMSPDEERKLAKFKDEIVAAFDNHKPSKPNITREERKELTRIRHDPNTVITPSDKSKKSVAMRQKVYFEKAGNLLSDSTMYNNIDLTINAYEEKVKSILKIHCQNMDGDELKSIIPSETRFPEFYGLPKDHKQNLPLRPVVSACDSPVTGIAIVLERVLHQLLEFLPAHLTNTSDALDHIRTICPDMKAPEGTILATMDVNPSSSLQSEWEESESALKPFFINLLLPS